MGFVHDKEEAEDLTQEIFLNVWKSLPKFRGDSSFSTWLHRIAVNACLNNKRKNTGNLLTRLSSFLGKENTLQEHLTLNEESPEDILIREENRAWLKKALDSLPENQHTAIVLSKYEDLSQKEIAGILNITEGAVEALIQRAKKNLREKLLSTQKEYKRRKNSDNVSK
jgi:RNA polymerase sigma-70 factor (ECF subfamily)